MHRLLSAFVVHFLEMDVVYVVFHGWRWLRRLEMAGEGVYLQHSSQCVMFTQSTSVVLVNVWHQSQFTVIEVLLICCLIHSASAVNSDI